MPETFRLISTATVGSTPVSSITFSSIPQTYTDLQIVLSLRSSYADIGDEFKFFINGEGGSDRVLYGFGTGGNGSNGSGNMRASANASTATANSFGIGHIYIHRYAGSEPKVISTETFSEGNASGHGVYVSGAKTTNISPVTSVSLTLATTSWVQYSSASLYGILKGNGGATVS